jgi:hypothetical protein
MPSDNHINPKRSIGWLASGHRLARKWPAFRLQEVIGWRPSGQSVALKQIDQSGSKRTPFRRREGTLSPTKRCLYGQKTFSVNTLFLSSTAHKGISLPFNRSIVALYDSIKHCTRPLICAMNSSGSQFLNVLTFYL